MPADSRPRRQPVSRQVTVATGPGGRRAAAGAGGGGGSLPVSLRVVTLSHPSRWSRRPPGHGASFASGTPSRPGSGLTQSPMISRLSDSVAGVTRTRPPSQADSEPQSSKAAAAQSLTRPSHAPTVTVTVTVAGPSAGWAVTVTVRVRSRRDRQ